MSSYLSNATQYGTFPSSKPDEASLAVTAVETDNDSTWGGKWLNRCSSAANSAASAVRDWVRERLLPDGGPTDHGSPGQLSQQSLGGADDDPNGTNAQIRAIAEASTGTF